jgi:Cu2+-containing amine oxidase
LQEKAFVCCILCTCWWLGLPTESTNNTNHTKLSAFAHPSTTNHPTTTGYFGPKEDPSKRLAWALMYYKERPEDNTYARPVEGVRVVVDLLKQ